MKTVNKIDWKGVAQKIAEDKKRINAHKNTNSADKLNDIKFVIPAALRM